MPTGLPRNCRSVPTMVPQSSEVPTEYQSKGAIENHSFQLKILASATDSRLTQCRLDYPFF